jgi:hypothetical protein
MSPEGLPHLHATIGSNFAAYNVEYMIIRHLEPSKYDHVWGTRT